MSSNAEELSAKLAALAKAREEKEARRKQEEEQERLKEELLQKELKRVEAEEKKREAEERKRRKAEEEQRKKDEVKVALAAAEAKKRAEAEKAETGKKRKDMEGSGKGTRMMEDGVLWYTQSDAVCKPCEKSGEVCLWRDLVWARACRACHNCKKECPVPDTRPDTRKGSVGKAPQTGTVMHYNL
jgi:hypothetical protein